ncbi:hypothetical protein MXB_705 [Myxobolus squamalis]|nr:hypothetical protein MXB_705 [Myxobolus squamalis]
MFLSLKMFPTISMWCSFHDVCSHCIHNEQFLLQWANVSLFLTQKVLNLCSLVNLNFFEKLSKFNFMDECFIEVDTQTVVHLWLKLFHSCGNLAILGETMEMCRQIWPETVAYEMQVNHAVDPKESSSNFSDQFLPIFKNINSVLPGSFFNSMRFLSSVVQLFVPQVDCKNINFIDWYNGSKETSQSSVYQASRTKSKNLNIHESFDPVACKLPSFFDDFSIELFQIEYSDSSLFDSKSCICFSDFQFFNNSSCYIESNTVLDLISEWLIGSCVSFKDIKISENIDYVIKHNYDLTYPTSMDPNFKLNLSDSFEIGRAYAFNIMLRLFTHQPDNSKISSAYKSRFYVLLCIGLLYHQHRAGFIFASIILSSARLFCCDLLGVEVLIPHYLRAINTILTQKNISYGNRINSTEVQNAALRILNSIIPLVLDISQFQTSDISQFSGVTITYETISNYTIDTLIEGITEESNIVNVQLCLSAITVLFYDLIHCCPFIPNTIGDSFYEFATLPSPDKDSQSDLNDTNPIIAIMNKFYMNVSKQINSCLDLIAPGHNFNINFVFSLVESYYMLSIIPSQLISNPIYNILR